MYDEGVAVPALDDAAVESALAGGAVVHDARSDQDFGVAHLRGSINVPADGRMAETVGMVLAPEQSVVVIAHEGQEQEVATRFARIGFDNVVGLRARARALLPRARGGRRALQPAHRDRGRDGPGRRRRAAGRHPQRRRAGRRDDPGCGAHPAGGAAPALRASCDPHRPVLLYCAGGWRSSVGASALRAQGFADVSDVLGGYNAWLLGQPQAS